MHAAQGEICDVQGNCVDATNDEVFKLTSKGGKMEVEVEKVRLTAAGKLMSEICSAPVLCCHR